MTPEATEKRLAGVIAAFVVSVLIWVAARSCELPRRELVQERSPVGARR